jgi:mRNA interferase RelE/StbE
VTPVYEVTIRPAALRALRQIDRPAQIRIHGAIALLQVNPRPPAARPLTGRDAWRIRIGDYRIIYEIHDARLVITVVTIGHRHHIYR